jgi:hypothetical protein
MQSKHQLFLNPQENLLQDLRNFNYAELLVVENRLLDWIGTRRSNSHKKFKSLTDFFQKNYISTQLDAFSWGLYYAPDELNFAWISHLHSLSTNKLHDQDGGKIQHSIRRHSSFLLFPSMLYEKTKGSAKKASPGGIESLAKELFDAHDQEEQGRNYLIICNREGSIIENKLEAQTAKQFYELQQEICLRYETDIASNQSYFTAAEWFAAKDINETATKNFIKLEASIIKDGYEGLLCYVGYLFPNKNPFHIRAKAERMIREYNQNIKLLKNTGLNTSTPYKHDIYDSLIDTILILVKGLLNLHVWDDGNGRLCAHHLLNLLLIKNDLPPTLLKNNCLDAFTIEELRDRVKEGIISFKAKCIASENNNTRNSNTNNNHNNHSSSKNNKNENKISKSRLHLGSPANGLSPFSSYIINNDIENAKTYHPSHYRRHQFIRLTEQDLNHFSCCSEAKLNWLFPGDKLPDLYTNYIFIDFQAYNIISMIAKLITLSLSNANESLLRSLIEFCLENNISLSEKQTHKILKYCNFTLFKVFEATLSKKIILNVDQMMERISDCRDAEVAKALINICFNQKYKLHYENKMSYEFISKVFTNQYSSVVLELLELPSVIDFISGLYHQSKQTDLQNLFGNIIARSSITSSQLNCILIKAAGKIDAHKVDAVLKCIKPDQDDADCDLNAKYFPSYNKEIKEINIKPRFG